MSHGFLPSNPIYAVVVEVWVRTVMKSQLHGHCKSLAAPESFWTFEVVFTGRAWSLYFPHPVGLWPGQWASILQHVLGVSSFKTGLLGWRLEHRCYLLIRCLKCPIERFCSLLPVLLVILRIFLGSFFFFFFWLFSTAEGSAYLWQEQVI